MLEGMQTNRTRRKRILWRVAVVLTIVVFAALAGFFFLEAKQAKDNPDASKQATTRRIVEKVGKLYQLPNNETPTVAQVQDKTKLKDQSFFASAENGDYILVYTEAKIALLYREKSNKLVNVGPVNLSSNDKNVAGDSTER